MSLLVFAGLALRIHKIGDRRSPVLDGPQQHPPNDFSKPPEFGGLQVCRQTRGVNARLPQTLIGINIPNAAKDPLIEQERFDACVTSGQQLAEFTSRNFQRLLAQAFSKCSHLIAGYQQHLPKAADIRVP